MTQMTNALVASILLIRHFDHCFVIRHSDFVITRNEHHLSRSDPGSAGKTVARR